MRVGETDRAGGGVGRAVNRAKEVWVVRSRRTLVSVRRARYKRAARMTKRTI